MDGSGPGRWAIASEGRRSDGRGSSVDGSRAGPSIGYGGECGPGQGPGFGAVHYKDTVRTIEDAKRAADVGAIGLQVTPPVFNDPSQEDILRYFGAVCEAIDIGVMIYNTPWLRNGAIYPDTFRRMTGFERVVAIKWSPPPGVEYAEIFDVAGSFNIMDNADNPVECHRLGGRGVLTDGVDAYPPYYLGFWDMLEAGKYDEAQAEWDRVVAPLRRFYAEVTEKSGGQSRVAKAMSAIMGMPMGPPRPPSTPLDEGEIAELRELMVGWGWPVAGASEAVSP